jgi:glycosyltransferase involved in cell wall biosynthesis
VSAGSSRIPVAIVTNWLGMGGTEKSLVSFATTLDRERFDVRVVVVRGDGPRRPELDAAGIPTYVVDQDADRLSAALGGVQVAHVFRTGLTERAVPAACRAAGVPHLIETNVFGRVDASSDEQQFDCHLFVGKMCAWRYRKRQDLWEPDFDARHRVLHWPIDLKRLRALAPPREEAKRALGLDPSRPVVGRIGRADDTKWRRLLVDMVPDLVRLVPEAQVMLVGATADKRRRLRRLGFDDRVAFVDTTVDEKETVTRLAACDVFITAAEIGESYSVAISEAMALGLPVVSCSTPWVDNGQIEQIDQGVTGHVADHPLAFAEACADLLRDPEKAAAFGRAAARKADLLMDRIVLTRQLESLYEAVVAGPLEPDPAWTPPPGEVDDFGAEYARRLKRSFRPLSRRERGEVELARRAEQVRWAWRAARKVDLRNPEFLLGTIRARGQSVERALRQRVRKVGARS